MSLYKFNLHAVPSLVLFLFIFSLGIFVFVKNKKNIINKLFLLFCIFYAYAMFCTFMMFLSQEDRIVITWDRYLYISVIVIPAIWYHLIVSFIKIKNRKNLIIWNYFISTIFLMFSQTKYFVDGIYYYSWGSHSQARVLHHFYLIYFISVFIRGLLDVFIIYKKADTPLQRNQLKYLTLSFSALAITGLGFLTAYNVDIYPFIYQIFGMLFVIIFAYAIAKHRLMDIRVVITRTGIFIVVYTLVLGLPFLLVALGKNWLIRLLGLNWWLGPLILLAVLATVGPFVYIYLQKRAEAMLLREQRGYQEILKQAARELARIRNLKRLLNLIVHIVTKTVRISHSSVYLYDDKFGQFFLKASRNLKRNQIASLSKEDPLIRWFESLREPLVYEEIIRESQNGSKLIFKELVQKMDFLNAAVIVPGFLKDKLLGFLVLGNKRSGGFYTSEDLNTFSVLANQAALAVENALLYENIEEQVRQRTKELLEVQKQLIQAEKLATVGTLAGGVAHEINNPLTAILTNVQMLSATSDSFDADSRESLELIEEATKRCRTIVQKLMTYAKKPLEAAEIYEVNLLNVIKNVISFLEYQLGQENIRIITYAKEDAYLVMGNRNELEQVVTNIILNARDAIKQIKRGGTVNISLSKSGDWIKIEIKDEGIGIPQEAIPKIFDPFFTTKEVGKGTGLGLSICQSIIEKHNGMIAVQSEPNKGSVFTVQLPMPKVTSKLKIGTKK